ncbi:MAG: ACT domain-containing protein [Candidatus Micrarchaeia archaeon]
MKPIILVENDRVGLLADISYILAKNKINIDTISVNVIGDRVVLVLTLSDNKKAVAVLGENGYKNIKEDYFAVKVDDKPGELNRITSMLSKAKVRISNVHLLTRDGKHTVIALKTDKAKKAREVLKDFLVENE